MQRCSRSIERVADDRRSGPDHRRDRDRQGTRRTRGPPEQPRVEGRSSPQLRGRAREPARKRVLRLREGRLHRRRPPARRRFEQADGGTLFLDEIGAMRTDLQAKLLRAIQEKEVQRLGSTPTVPSMSDRRRDLRGSRAGDPRAHLPRRPVLPPQRGADPSSAVARTQRRHPLAGRSLPGLGEREVRPRAAEHGAGGPRVALTLPWPGNVRELENCIERMVVLAQGERLTMADVPTNLQPGRRTAAAVAGRSSYPRRVSSWPTWRST